MKTGTYISLGEAAKQAGVSKATISKALKTGRLSYVEKSSAGYKIDPSEVARVYPPKQVEAVTSERSETPQLTAMEARIEAQAEIMETLRAQIEDLRTDRDEWRRQAQTLALADQRNAPQEPQKSPAGGLFGLFRRVGT